MAEAYGKLTGRPGIAFVTRGPGASNAAIGIHTAAQDSTPLIVFVGQVGTDIARSRGLPGDRLPAHVRQRRQVGRADRPRRAHSRSTSRTRTGCAMSGRPGPVVLALPEDMLASRADAADRAARRRRAAGAAGRGACVRRAQRCCAARARRSCIVGGSRWDAQRCERAARRSPSAGGCRSRARSAIRTCSTTATRTTPATSASASTRARRARARRRRAARDRRAAGRDDDVGLHAARRSRCRAQALIHVHPGAEELGRVYQPRARDRRDARRASSPRSRRCAAPAAARRRARAGARARRVRRLARAAPGAGRASTCGRSCAGSTSAARRRDRHQRRRQLRDAGCTGFPLPRLSHAARAVLGVDGLRRAGGDRRQARCIPSASVVSWNGDGCFLMNGQELATAVQYGLGDRVRGDRQRHVRHDPHAPGAQLSGARVAAPTLSIPISPRSRAPTARMAKRCRDRRVRAGVRARAAPPASRRCCTSRSTRRR